jgi:hypothetical protein
VSTGQGVLGAAKSLAQAFGADNAPAEALGNLQTQLGTFMSPERQAEQKRRVALEKEAAKSGSVLNELATGVGGVAEAPIQSTAQGIGSSIPTVLLGMGAGAAGAALGAPLALAAGIGIAAKYLIGALQGAGEVKGSIYDTVYNGLREQGVSKEEAKKQALGAQEYTGGNWGTIAAAAGIGGIAGGTGVESELLKRFSKPVAVQAAKELAEKAAAKEAAKSGTRKTVEAMLKEAVPEGIQGGQEQYAQNVAQTRAGMETPAMQGVLGAAARDAAMGALTAGAAHNISSTPATPEPKTPPPPATQPSVVTPEAPTTPTEYADLAKELAQLRATEQTPEVKARAALIADLLKDQDVAAIEAARKQKEQAAVDTEKAQTSAFAEPTQMEMREALPREAIIPPTDLFGNPLEAAPDEAAPRVSDLYGGTNLTTEDLRDAGLAPSPQDLEAAGQQTLNLTGALTMDDIKALNVPMGTGVTSWVNKNVVGKTQEEVQAMVDKDPTLVTQKGERAKVLKELLAPQPAKFEETTDGQTPATSPAVQPRSKPRTGKPSVGVSGEPAAPVVSKPQSRVSRTPGKPAAPVGLGLVSSEQPAGAGVTSERAQSPAVTNPAPVPNVAVETAEEEAARKAEAEAVRKALATPPKKPAPPPAAPAPVTKTAPPEAGLPRYDVTAAQTEQGLANPFDMIAQYKKRKDEAEAGRESVATAKGQSLEALKKSIASAKGPLGHALRRMVKSGKVKLEETHPSGRPVGGYYDGSTVTLYANGIPEGKILPVALHEVAAHMGMAKMLGQEMYNNVGDRIMEWAQKGDGSFESKIAQLAYKRIPIRDMKRGPEVFQDELIAYFIEEMAKAEANGELPKSGTIRTLWNRIRAALAKAFGKELKADINPAELTAEDIYAMAHAAFVEESKTGPVQGEEKALTSIDPELEAQAEGLVPKKKNLIASIKSAGASVIDKESGISIATKIRTRLTDQMATVEQRLISKYDQGITDELGKTMPTVVARQAQDVDKLMQAFYEEGAMTVDPKTRMLYVEEGKTAPNDVFPIIQEMAKQEGMDFEHAFAYASTVLEGMRLNDLVKSNHNGQTDTLIHWRTPDGKVDQAKINKAVAAYNANPMYKQLADIMDAPRIHMINQLEAAGRLTPEQAKVWREVSNYVPFDRIEDFDKTFSGNKRVTTRGLASLGQLPVLKGSEVRAVGNVFENYFKTMRWMGSQLAKQNANSYMMDAMVSAGFAKKLHDKNQSRTGNIVTVYVKGEPTPYEVASKWDQVAFLEDNGPIPKWVRFFGEAANITRTAVTGNPVFAAGQVALDIQGAMVFSGVKHPLAFITASIGNFGTLAWHETSNVFKTILGKEASPHQIETEMRKLGLSGSVDYSVADPAIEELIRQGVRQRTKLGSTTLGAIIHGLEQITHSSDLAIRKALFDDEMKASNDLLRASTKARELINFRRRGSSQLMQHLTVMVPFLNAAAQSSDIVYRSVMSQADPSGLEHKAARAQFKKNAMMYAGVALLYTCMRSGDDDYEKMDRRKRDGNWILPNHVAIPIRGDMAVLKVAIENGMDYWRRHGTKEELEAGEAIKTTLAYAFEQYVGRITPIPSAIKPLLENFTNFSFMTGRAQVGTYQQTKPKHLQEASNTSEMSKAIAEFVYKEFKGMEVSPVHIDNVLRGWLGTSAASATMLVDAMINPNKPDRPLHKMAVIGAFAWDETQLVNSKNEFYDLQAKVLPPVRVLNELKGIDLNKAREYAQEHKTELLLASTVNQTLKQLSEVRKARKFLESERGAIRFPDHEERDAKLAELIKREDKITSYVRGLRHKVGI